MRFKENDRALILAPHCDDGELGLGGTISKLVSGKVDVVYVAFSLAEKSIPKGLPPDTTRKEVYKATDCLGIPAKNVILYDFEVRIFTDFRQKILDSMIELQKKINPKVVFIPSLSDKHQDHQVIAIEAIRAFKGANIFSYDLPWNSQKFTPNLFISISKIDLDRKKKSISCYESQKNKIYMNDDFVESLAIVRGAQSNYRYAEAFEIVKCNID
ncbi:PIG-L deacetylase family protein [Polynucleobacter difficilis]|uniref:PIG-L deacetylase family protein n=1 Tax=Polynucleobacter difficilis TaxID=556054 RepID=UPI000D3DB4EE|nr:PIG-L family deacetylase [Polynucleobacter difficilis]